MKALRNLSVQDIVFIDIETVRGEYTLKAGSPTHDAWAYKMRYENEGKSSVELSLEESYNSKAALYAEFGRIVCITVGRISPDGKVSLKDFAGDDECKLLTDFTAALNKVCELRRNSFLFGHAIKGFDIPFIFRRCIINGIEPNHLFDLSTMKPWEASAVDTLELWKNGGFYSASLLSLSNAFGLPSPKNGISGSEVSDIYWNSKEGITRIVQYCRRDVLTIINLYLKMTYQEPIILDEIYNIEEPEVKSVVKKPAPKRYAKSVKKVVNA